MKEKPRKFKELKDLNLLDSFLFEELAEDQEALEAILGIVLGNKIKLLKAPETEKEERTNPQFKQVRIDVCAFDEDNIYDIEVQQEMKNDLRKRIRFYSSLMDYQFLKSGTTSYNDLKNSYIIMIAPFDLFGDERYKYTFKMTCQENKEIELGDEQTVIFLNTNGKVKEGASQELIDMLKYFQETKENTENKSGSDNVKLLHKKVDLIKSNEKVGVRYMNRWEEKIEDREEGRKEGVLEIARKMKEKGMQSKEILELTGLNKKEIEEL